MDDAGTAVSQPHSGSGQLSEKKSTKDPAPRPKVNKRTKTGCLTCRKRRIKCDEGRPVCNKCTKSKRHCDGYNQKVTFKNPYSSFPAAAHGPTIYPPGSSLAASHPGAAGSSTQGALQAIAPKPPPLNMDYFFLQEEAERSRRAQATYVPHHMPQHQQFAQAQPDHAPQPTQGIFYEDLTNSAPSYYFNFYPGPAHTSLSEPVVTEPSPYPPVAYQHSSQPNHITSTSLGAVSTRFNAPAPAPISPASYSTQTGQTYAPASQLDGASSTGQPGTGSFQPQAEGATSQSQDDEDVDDMAASDDEQPDVWSLEEIPYIEQLSVLEPELRALFHHFVHFTGPCISMYERYSFSSSFKEQLCPIPHNSGPSLWSRTFPLMSLGHPALLHAVLAMASLQLGNLRRVKPEVAYKQYSIAIRRLRRNATSDMRLKQPATLAAALLLAYFDVWRSDHKEWSRHIFGARTIVAFLGLRDMSRRCLRAKLMHLNIEERITGLPSGAFFPTSGSDMRTGSAQYIDFGLLSEISGFKITPAVYDLERIPNVGTVQVSDREIQTYENFRDLFWWYCKMDLYQSILGATKLFMRYKDWTACPPRAPMNRVDAIYGTYDHLILLLGRVAEFAARDIARKREAFKVRMGWARGKEKRASPPFMGLLPAAPEQAWQTGLPSSRDLPGRYRKLDDTPRPFTNEEDACREWGLIRKAFTAFKAALGPDFQPVNSQQNSQQGDFESSKYPFGPPLQYRTFPIAGIWMNYHMGLIYLRRLHPECAPAMMHAARDTAKDTSGDARTLGQIATGLVDDCSGLTASDVPICAALIESAFCLFVAGIQYRKKTQRQWLILRMHDITRITGWRTASQIASGCESAWLSDYLSGDGPIHLPLGFDREAGNTLELPRRLDQALLEARSPETRPPGTVIHELFSVQIPVDHADRAHFALGLLGVESDLENLVIQDESDDDRRA